MIGQYYNKITLETIKSIRDDFIIVHGTFRSGKTTLVKEVYKDYNIIDCDTNAEGFDRLIYSLLSNKSKRKLYLIQNCDGMKSGVFNKILKSAEEITKLNSTLVMEYKGEYPETLKTRAKIIDMAPYKREDIKSDNLNIVDIAQSPGIVNYLENAKNFEKSYEIAMKVYENIHNVSIGNLLKIPQIIDDEELDYITILLTLMRLYVNGNIECFSVVSKLYYSYTLSNRLNMNIAFTDMLLELKSIYDTTRT